MMTPQRPSPVGIRQRSFDDLATPLYDVTFCAVDLETTGTSPKTCEIVEIGAAKSKGGEPAGTFSTLVRPYQSLPVAVQVLTGIAPTMLEAAEPLPSVLPALLEFCRGTVFVAHNARFDHSFLKQACANLDYEMPEMQIIDTARLARRLLSGEVRNCRLGTLAAHFRTTNKPCHRAFPDAAACLEILHLLLERAAAYGVMSLQELIELQKVKSNPHAEKVKMARDLPKARGVYQFLNARREVIYVGKATDLRSRVRSYFVSDERKRISDLRSEVDSVRVEVCATDVESTAIESRLIERLAPRYNRQGKAKRTPVYLKLTMRDKHPRFSVTTALRDDGGVYVGPFNKRSSAAAAATVIAGLFAVRTCTMRITASTAVEPCPLYRLGSCCGPCTGRAQDIAAHEDAVARLEVDLASGLRDARDRLASKLTRLSEHGRFEEAAEHRDAFETIASVVDRARNLQAVAAAGRVVVLTVEGAVVINNGFLDGGPQPVPEPSDGPSPLALEASGLNERRVIASFIGKATRIESERPIAWPWPPTARLTRLDIPDGEPAAI